jgi:hypothetical protein
LVRAVGVIVDKPSRSGQIAMMPSPAEGHRLAVGDGSAPPPFTRQDRQALPVRLSGQAHVLDHGDVTCVVEHPIDRVDAHLARASVGRPNGQLQQELLDCGRRFDQLAQSRGVTRLKR